MKATKERIPTSSRPSAAKRVQFAREVVVEVTDSFVELVDKPRAMDTLVHSEIDAVSVSHEGVGTHKHRRIFLETVRNV